VGTRELQLATVLGLFSVVGMGERKEGVQNLNEELLYRNFLTGFPQ
jgi:hypothetical protein